ncbi:MAG: hypothetical protein WBB45_01320 [Cyclobacteriaceae bacterium]
MLSRLLITSVFTGLFLSGCGGENDQTTQASQEAAITDSTKSAESSFAESIGIAHGDDTWNSHQAIQGDITVVFNGSERIKGNMIAETSVGRVRIELMDSTILVWDGNKAWVSPDTSSMQGARFHLKTWPYFLAAPMKLDDPGTVWQDMTDGELLGQNYTRRKLTFKSGTGDSPDDWYIIYKEPDTDKLKAMSYIVTYGNTVEKASEAPHVIVYDDYQEVDGTMLARSWKFYNWSEEKGIQGDSIGYVTVSNLSFTEVADSLFTEPTGAREDKMPEK